MGRVERKERESRKLMKRKLENSTMTRTLMRNRFTADNDEFPSLINDKAEKVYPVNESSGCSDRCRAHRRQKALRWNKRSIFIHFIWCHSTSSLFYEKSLASFYMIHINKFRIHLLENSAMSSWCSFAISIATTAHLSDIGVMICRRCRSIFAACTEELLLFVEYYYDRCTLKIRIIRGR